MLVDELADVQQKTVDSVIAMELNTPEVVCVKFDLPDGNKPAKQVIQVGTGARVEFPRVVESLKGGLQDSVRKGVMLEFIPCTGSATVPEKIPAKRLSNEQLPAHARDLILAWEVATVQPTTEQPARAVHQHTGEEVEKVGGIQRVHLGKSRPFFQHVPRVAEQVVDVRDGDFASPTRTQSGGVRSNMTARRFNQFEARGHGGLRSNGQQLSNELFHPFARVEVFLEERLDFSHDDFSIPCLVWQVVGGWAKKAVADAESGPEVTLLFNRVIQ